MKKYEDLHQSQTRSSITVPETCKEAATGISTTAEWEQHERSVPHNVVFAAENSQALNQRIRGFMQLAHAKDFFGLVVIIFPVWCYRPRKV